MAFMCSCRHPCSSMATSSRFGTPKTTLRFSASVSAHGGSSSHLSFSSTANKEVFEDQLRGIVCYRDEKGELVCEGYDEGPRFGMRLPEKACFPWPVGVQVTDFIQLATLPVFEDADVLQFKNDPKWHL